MACVSLRRCATRCSESPAMGSSPSLCTMVSNSTLLPPYTTAVNSSSACTAHATLISVCNHSCDWCRRDGAAHRAQSAGSGRRARRLTGSGSEPSAASLLHTAPQLRTAGRDEQTSCKSRREQTQSLRPVSSVCCSCGADGRARAAYASSRARLSRQSVRPTPADRGSISN